MIVPLPAHVPAVAVSLLPCCSVPATAGRALATGPGAARTTPALRLSTVCLPAVTAASSTCPMSVGGDAVRVRRGTGDGRAEPPVCVAAQPGVPERRRGRAPRCCFDLEALPDDRLAALRRLLHRDRRRAWCGDEAREGCVRRGRPRLVGRPHGEADRLADILAHLRVRALSSRRGSSCSERRSGRSGTTGTRR